MRRKPETYTRRKGHYIGYDGFTVPRDFAEFLERFPRYVETWVFRNIRPPAVYDRDDVLDWTSQLHLHLMVLPRGSVRRTRTKRDVIAVFDPKRCEGASKAKFFRYVDFCLWNHFNQIWRKAGRDVVRRPYGLPVDGDGHPYTNAEWAAFGSGWGDAESDMPKQVSTRTVPKNWQAEQLEEEEKKEKEVFISQYRDFVEKHDPDLLDLMDAIGVAASLKDAQRDLEWPQNKFAHGRERLQVLAQCFRDGTPVPPRRKLYRTRTRK